MRVKKRFGQVTANRKNPTDFSPLPSWMIWPFSEGGRANVNLKETAPSFNPPMGWDQNLAKLLSENGKKIYLSQFDSMDGSHVTWSNLHRSSLQNPFHHN
jgi:hypothetical protein